MTEPGLPPATLPNPSTWEWLRRSALGTVSGCARGLGELIFPWQCVICQESCREGPFCSGCRTELLEASSEYAAMACPRCGMPAGPFADLQGGCGSCRRKRLPVEAVVALGTYDGALRDLCLSLKHEQSAWLAPRLGSLLAEKRLLGSDKEVEGARPRPQIPPDAWVVPVPLHWRRRWSRRYNQAEALARGIGRRLGIRLRQPLRRVMATPMLAGSGLSPTERVEIMRGAFQARRDPALQGRVVLLVDDILTTGATVGEAARVLKKAGASRVICAVLARAEGKRS